MCSLGKNPARTGYLPRHVMPNLARGGWAPGEAVGRSNSTKEDGRRRPQDWTDDLSMNRERRRRRKCAIFRSVSSFSHKSERREH